MLQSCFNIKLNKPRAKDVLPNTHHMQAPEITPSGNGMVTSATARRCLQSAHTICTLPGVMGVHSVFFVPGDLDL